MLLSLLLVCAVPADTVWQPVFSAAGASATAAGVDLAWFDTFGGGTHRNATFDALLHDPLRVPRFAEVTGRGLVATGPKPAGLLHRANALAGWAVRRGLVEPIAARMRERVDTAQPLAAALARVRQVGGMPGLAGAEPPTDDLPPELQQAMAVVLLTAAEVPQWRDWAFAGAPAAGLPANLTDLCRAVAPERELDGTALGEHERRLERIVDGLDLPALSAATGDLVAVVEEVLPALAAGSLPDLETRRWATPLGDVILGGSGDDTHEVAPLLLIETGGNDTYSVGASATEADRPVSIVIDAEGDDRYQAGAGSVGTFGAAVGGVALQLDLAGNDTYAGGILSQGAAVAGLALCWDAEGDDRYDAIDHALGAGVYGVGVLADLAGADEYRSVTCSQGYGFTLGAGVLVDVAGADRYVAEDEEITAPSAQSAEHNANLSQGFGFGRRADYTNGHGLCGGVGWLADGGGDDAYSCGVFGQGGGYWYGLGALTDLAGNDRYTGAWYVQGAAAHFAIGALLDADGSDQYTGTMNMAQGAGHDFSLGWLADLAGDDRYTAPNLGLGAGNANGVGFLLECAGDDSYIAGENLSLGRARTGNPPDLQTSTRQFLRTAGWFLDLAGRDTYPREPCGDGQTWTHADEGTAALGAGMDVP